MAEEKVIKLEMVNELIQLFNEKMPDASIERKLQYLDIVKEILKLARIERCEAQPTFHDELQKLIKDQSLA